MKTEVDTETRLEEILNLRVHCEAKGHSTDNNFHNTEADAEMRGYAPCGDVMNVCAKFAHCFLDELTPNARVRCQCSSTHLVADFMFVPI